MSRNKIINLVRGFLYHSQAQKFDTKLTREHLKQITITFVDFTRFLIDTQTSSVEECILGIGVRYWDVWCITCIQPFFWSRARDDRCLFWSLYKSYPFAFISDGTIVSFICKIHELQETPREDDFYQYRMAEFMFPLSRNMSKERGNVTFSYQ